MQRKTFFETQSRTDSSPILDCSFFDRARKDDSHYLKLNSIDLNEALQLPLNRYESYEQYVYTVNAVNAFLEGDANKFKNYMTKIGKTHDFKIVVDYTGVPYNPFAGNNNQRLSGTVEKTLLDVMGGYKSNAERAACLAILVGRFSPNQARPKP